MLIKVGKIRGRDLRLPDETNLLSNNNILVVIVKLISSSSGSRN
jgi:hypothetical protein